MRFVYCLRRFCFCHLLIFLRFFLDVRIRNAPRSAMVRRMPPSISQNASVFRFPPFLSGLSGAFVEGSFEGSLLPGETEVPGAALRDGSVSEDAGVLMPSGVSSAGVSGAPSEPVSEEVSDGEYTICKALVSKA